MPGGIDANTWSRDRAGEAKRRLVLVKVARFEKRHSNRATEPADARGLDQAPGGRDIEPGAFRQRGPARSDRGQQDRAVELVGGEREEIGRGETPSPHPAVSLR